MDFVMFVFYPILGEIYGGREACDRRDELRHPAQLRDDHEGVGGLLH